MAIPKQEANYPPPFVAWGLWTLAGIFYLLAFFHRVAPAVITRELMADFGISAGALGNLSGLYFYSYVAMQVPTGVLADVWGPRRLLSAGAGVAAVGGLLFALSPSYGLAGLGRLLVGGGVAVAYVGMIKLADSWLPPRLYAMSAGLALFIGIIGAVGAGAPLRFLVNGFGWRPAMAGAGVATLIIAVAIWLFLRDYPHEKGYKSWSNLPQQNSGSLDFSQMWVNLKQAMSRRNNWLLFFAPGGLVGPVTTFGGLWGVGYLRVRYGLDETAAGVICSTALVSWAVGGAILGRLSDKLGRRKPLYLGGCIAAFLGWSALFYLPGVSLFWFVAITVVTGLGTGGMVLSFAFGKESSPAHLAGTVAGFMNMGIMAGPALLQPAVGVVLDMYWHGQTLDGVRVYSLAAYQAGFALMLGWSLLACILIGLTRETYCKQC